MKGIEYKSTDFNGVKGAKETNKKLHKRIALKRTKY